MIAEARQLIDQDRADDQLAAMQDRLVGRTAESVLRTVRAIELIERRKLHHVGGAALYVALGRWLCEQYGVDEREQLACVEVMWSRYSHLTTILEKSPADVG